jgi:hypothetical protein
MTSFDASGGSASEIRVKTMDEHQRYQQGLATRRAVLGDAHVERALGQQDEFDRDFQDFITRYA